MPSVDRRSSSRRYPLAIPITLAVVGQVVAMVADGQVMATGASTAVPTWALATAGVALMVIAPGWLLIDLVLPERAATDRLERGLLVIAAGYGALVAWALVMHYVPGPLVPAFSTRMLAATGALALMLIVRRKRRPHGEARPVSAVVWAQVAAVVALGLVLRLPDIGYAEVQGDEATILLKAASALQGRTDAIFIHKKGPAELLIATAFYGLEDRASEALVRVPFAIATVAGLAFVFMLGRAMFSSSVGLVAGLALGLNGFFIGFARIVQYQAIVFLMTCAAIWCAWRLARSPVPDRSSGARARPGVWIGLGAFFIAIGILAHYDAVFAFPPVAWLVWRRWRAAEFDRRLVVTDLRRIALGATGAAVLLGIFFVPLASHPYFASTTLDYLVGTRFGGDDGGGVFHNPLLNSATLATFYSSTWSMLAISLLLLVEIGRRIGRRWGTAAGAIVAAGFGVVLAVAITKPEWAQLGSVNLVFPILVGLGGVVLYCARDDDGWSAAWLWFIVPFAIYGGFVKSPRTHFHVAFPAWMLLASLPVAAAWRRNAWSWQRRTRGSTAETGRAVGRGVARDDGVAGNTSAGAAASRPSPRVLIAVAGAALFLVSAQYAWWTFVRHDVEYRRAYPDGTPPGQWVALPDLPSSGWFGFPYRAGWKAIGALYADGAIRGDYHSNEEEWVTHWYTRGQPRCDDRPRYLFVAADVQDERPLSDDPSAEGYVLVAVMTSGARDRLDVWRRADLPVTAAELPAPAIDDDVPRFAVDAFEGRFDAEMTGSRFDPGLPYARDLQVATARPAVDFGGKVRLAAVRTDPPDVSVLSPGERVLVTLAWESLAPMEKDYSVFLHLEKEGVAMLAQDDGSPRALAPKGACGEASPTTTWQPGDRIIERRVLELPAGGSDVDGDGGRFELLVGLYDYETLERLRVTDPDGQDLGTRYAIGAARVVGPDATSDRGDRGGRPRGIRGSGAAVSGDGSAARPTG